MSKKQMMIWHRMLYSCTCMAAVGVKGLMTAASFVCEADTVNRSWVDWRVDC